MNRLARVMDVLSGDTGDRKRDLQVRIGWAASTGVVVVVGMIRPTWLLGFNAMFLCYWICRARAAWLSPKPGCVRVTIDCPAGFVPTLQRYTQAAASEWEADHA